MNTSYVSEAVYKCIILKVQEMLQEMVAVGRAVEEVKTGWLASEFSNRYASYRHKLMCIIADTITREILRPMKLELCFSTVSGFYIHHVARSGFMCIGIFEWDKPPATQFIQPTAPFIATVNINFINSIAARIREEESFGPTSDGVEVVSESVTQPPTTRGKRSRNRIAPSYQEEQSTVSGSHGYAGSSMSANERRYGAPPQTPLSIVVPAVIPANGVITVILPDSRQISVVLPPGSRPGSQVIINT